MPAKYLPICSATVEVLGYHWPEKAAAWAGFYWDKAEVWETSLVLNDHHLLVPWAHPDDPPWDDDAMYRVRPKDCRYRFVRAPNGNWILELSGTSE